MFSQSKYSFNLKRYQNEYGDCASRFYENSFLMDTRELASTSNA
jgi:hypothetical protein